VGVAVFDYEMPRFVRLDARMQKNFGADQSCKTAQAFAQMKRRGP
jgi:hypothetical protein